MIWPHGARPFGTLGTVRQHPRLGTVNEARIVADGNEVADGEVGELELRSPAVMRGYWGMPEETARVVDSDGWLRTGDLVHRNPDGTYTFVGRQKEVIRRRGENVAPAEIEEALCTHADVTEAAVIGVPSELTEEEIKGFVAVSDPESADLAAIREAAAALLAPFKVPRYLEAVAELPAHADRAGGQARALARADGRRDGLRRGAGSRAEGRMSDGDWLRTDIGGADADSITVRGRDLASELMGKVTFTELTYLLVRGRAPTPQETVLLDAVLVSLAEHGLTPTVLAARLTHTGAPESLQGAVASGLLGAGTVFLGVVEDTAVFLEGVLAAAGPGAGDDALARAAVDAVRAQTDAGKRIPGIGHPVHKVEDPRTARIYAIAAEQGARWPAPAGAPARRRRPSRRHGQGPSDQRRRRGGRRARRPRLPGADRPRHGAPGPHRRPGRPPRRGDDAPARHAALPRRRAPRAGRLALVEGHLARLLVGGERSRRRVNAVVARAARHVGPDHARHVPLLERVERL